MRALDALRTAPGTILPGIGSMILAVKERILSQCHRLHGIFTAAAEPMTYPLKIAA